MKPWVCFPDLPRGLSSTDKGSFLDNLAKDSTTMSEHTMPPYMCSENEKLLSISLWSRVTLKPRKKRM